MDLAAERTFIFRQTKPRTMLFLAFKMYRRLVPVMCAFSISAVFW